MEISDLTKSWSAMPETQELNEVRILSDEVPFNPPEVWNPSFYLRCHPLSPWQTRYRKVPLCETD